MKQKDLSLEKTLAKRFRGFLPVVVDVETGGLNPDTDALLEIALVLFKMDDEGVLRTSQTHSYHVQPFEGGRLDPEALKINKIDPDHPFRFAIPELEALEKSFAIVQEAVKQEKCQRAILVGHNAWFDLFFLKAAVARCKIKNNPFHSFSSLDTVSLSALSFGQTVLARSVETAGIPFDRNEAHSAIYDAEKTAELFCHIVNKWRGLSTEVSAS